MDFLSQLLRGIAFVPALVNGIEGGKSSIRNNSRRAFLK